VVYPTLINSHLPYKDALIIDVPIGKLTVPLSRESLEDTPSNSRVCEEINTALDELYKERLSLVPPISLMDLMHASDVSIKDDWFDFSRKNISPEGYRAAIDVKHYYSSIFSDDANDANTIYVIPNNTSKKTWVTRLANHLKKKAFRYALEGPRTERMVANVIEGMDSSGVTFINVRKMKLPALVPVSKNAGAFNFKRNGYSKTVPVEEMNSDIIDEFFGGVDEPDWKDKVDTMTALNNRTFYCEFVCPYLAPRNRRNIWTVTSKKAASELEKLGWLPFGTEYRMVRDRIQVEIDKQEALQTKAQTVATFFRKIRMKDKFRRKLETETRPRAFFEKVMDNCLDKTTSRGRILKELSSWHGLERKDIKAILTLK